MGAARRTGRAPGAVRRLGAGLLGAALVLSGCTPAVQGPGAGEDASPVPDTLAPAAAPGPAPDQGLPVDALPDVPGGRDNGTQCPYLDSEWVAETNGQRITGVGVDERFDTPACVFWSYPEAPQVQVIVRQLPDEEQAIAVVDWAAPVEHTEPADQPAGWMGGRGGAGMVPGRDGAVYAVQSGPVAVVVFSNQEQSFKAEQIALEAITNLGL